MKQSEKLDLILKELFKHKNDGKFHSISLIFQSLYIPFDSVHEIHELADRLHRDGFINSINTLEDGLAKITGDGIEYCEENSYSYVGHSINTNEYKNISIVNSPYTNIVTHSSNVKITQSISEVNQAIEKIRETITSDKTIETITASEISDCLIEIQDCINNNLKPKYAIKSLLDIAGGISSIASWLTVLGQYAGLIQLPGI